MDVSKKYPTKGCNVDLSPFVPDFLSNKFIPDFNYHYDYFSETLDPRFPDPLFPELGSTMFVDANHVHDSVTGKSITGFASFIANMAVK